MDNENSTFGLAPEKMAELGSMGEGDSPNTPSPDTDQYSTELLHDQLAQKLPLEQVVDAAVKEAASQSRMIREVSVPMRTKKAALGAAAEALERLMQMLDS